MMTRQLFLFILYFFIGSHFALALTPKDNTLVVPSPQNEKPTPPSQKLNNGGYEKDGLLSEKNSPAPPESPVYHLEPRPSLTLALSRAYEPSEKDHTGWLGLRIAPWMTATTRVQFGLDIHDKFGWLEAALHSLPTRNLYRLYWGGGLDVIIDGREELRPLMRIKNYHAFLAGGWELQLLDKQNIRFEISYHQGTKTGFAKATLGYTFLF
jgi:hypothetical protein